MNNSSDKKRKEILKMIKDEICIIQQNLNSLKIYDYEHVLGKLNKSFYDETFASIKSSFGLAADSSVNVLLNNEHLVYRYNLLKLFERKLNKEKNNILSESQSERTNIVFDIATNTGSNLRKVFIKEHHNQSPLTNLKNINGETALKKLFIEKLKLWEKYDIDVLEEARENYKNILKEQWKQRFYDEKAYGTCMGEINKGFYGHTQKELCSILHTRRTVDEISDIEHTRYRDACLYFAVSYLSNSRKDINNINDFYKYYQTKLYQIGQIGRAIYIENNKENQTPFQGLKKLNEEQKAIKAQAKNATRNNEEKKAKDEYNNGFEQMSFYKPEKKASSRKRKD